ncbi:MAG: signal recognition particle protein [Bacilli bacterium]
MAFEGLSQRLQNAMQKIRGKGKVTEADVKEMMREVRLALLEADVNFKVVKNFVNRVSERAIGSDVMDSLTPGQQVVKIVNEELTELMGRSEEGISFSKKPQTVIMMVGLQGAGKTTTTGKLANLLRKKHDKKPQLVACDVYRPAAVDQLKTVGRQLDLPVYDEGTSANPVEIAKRGLEKAYAEHNDVVFLDTAGRLHIDENLMDELKQMKAETKPDEIFLVVDAMTGQVAVDVAQSFHNELGITGVILTKLDGDTRGGAALSIRAVTGLPIKFIGVGEKMDALEVFHPERMSSRILGMGDVLSLIERAQDAVDEKQAREMQEKMRNADFTLDDFLDQLAQVRKLGPIEDILKMIPGMGGKMKGLQNLKVDEKQISRLEAIMRSMTTHEKRNPEILHASRKRRIALGSGTSVAEVNRLLKQFEEMKKMMKMMSGATKGKKKKKGFPFPFM